MMTGKRLRSSLEKASKKESTTTCPPPKDSAALESTLSSYNVNVSSSIEDLSIGAPIDQNYLLSTQLSKAQQPQGFGSLIINNSKLDRKNYRVSEIQTTCNENCGCPIPCIGGTICKCTIDGTTDDVQD
ncbi:hypothetical protein ACH5RR_001295 [Cinchona calisaya]|uniref:Uncharacterized protein n=1 Tax=Cinchona calisaya TaxID=153742 RepID=A0ABD3B334_9GENT